MNYFWLNYLKLKFNEMHYRNGGCLLFKCSIFILLLTSSISANQDMLQLVIDNKIASELRWDNLEGGDEWLQGSIPKNNSDQYVVTVAAGKWISIFQPPQSWLRIVAGKKLNIKNDLFIEQSIDGYLFAEKSLIINDQSQILLQPVIQTSIIRLKNKSNKAIKFSLYRSRTFISSPQVAYARHMTIPNSKNIDLQIFPDRGLQRYYQLDSLQSKVIKVKGPTRLAVLMRRPFINTAFYKEQSNIEISLGKLYKESHDLYFEEDYRHTFRLKGERISVSDLSTVYVNIPSGEHKLKFKSANQLYVQIREMKKTLWLTNNSPAALDDLTKNTSENQFNFEKVEKRVFERIKNNHHHPDTVIEVLNEIRLKIKNTVYNEWSTRQYLIELENKIKQKYTHFKSVLIATNNDSLNDYQHKFIRYIKSQLQFSKGITPYYLSKKLYKSRLNEIGEQSFHFLKNEKIRFNIESSNVDSDMQLLIYSPKKSVFNKIWIQQDNHPPQLITLRNNFDIDSRNKYTVINKLIDSQDCCESLLGSLAIDKGGINLRRVASIQVKLKADVKSIKVLGEKGKNGLWVALQQRRGNINKLSESHYLFELKDKNVFDEFVMGMTKYREIKNQSNAIKSTVLENQWLPLYRQFDGAYKKIIHNIKPQLSNIDSKLTDNEIQEIQTIALKSEKNQQWDIAMQYWSKLWLQAAGEMQPIAAQHMVMCLNKLAQYSLSRQLQLSIIFNDYDNTASNSSFSSKFINNQIELLLEKYNQQNNGDAKIAFLSAYFVKKPDKLNLSLLSNAMIEEGRWRDGLQLMLLLPDSMQSIDMILLAALKNNWHDVFERKIKSSKLDADKVNKWRGMKSLFLHNYDVAKKYFNKVVVLKNNRINVWLSILEQSKKINKKLLSLDIESKKQAIFEWQFLQDKINKKLIKEWKTEIASIVSHAGQVEIVQSGTKLKLMNYVSRPKKPLKLLVAGPLKLRLQIRPIHTIINNDVKPINSYFEIIKNGVGKSYLINHNMPADNWRINEFIKTNNKVPGQRIIHEIDIEPGIHELGVSGEEDLLVRFQRQVNIIPASSLPQITTQNMSFILNENLTNDENKLKLIDKYYADDLKGNNFNKNKSEFEKLQEVVLNIENKNYKNKLENIEFISMSEKIYSDNNNSEELTSTMLRLRKYGRWELLNSINSSDGYWIQQYNSYNPESPTSRIYKALLNNVETADELLLNGSKQIISIFNPQTSEIKLQFRGVSPLFIHTQNIDVSYQVDDGEIKTQSISNLDKQILIPLSAGKHNIKINVLKAPIYHRLFMKLQSDYNNNKKQRRYHIASDKQNLVYQLEGPAWLRIDKLVKYKNENNIGSRYQYYPKGDHFLTLTATEKEAVAYYRVFMRKPNNTVLTDPVLNWQDSTDTSNNRIKNVNTALNLFDKDNATDFISKNKIELGIKDEWELGRQQSGTTSLLLTRVDQNLIINELAVTSDQYIETELAYRKHNPLSQNINGRWFYLAGLVRVREEGNTSLGIKSRLRGQFNAMPIDWTIDGRAYAQEFNSTSEMSMQFQLRLSQTRWLGSQFYHLPKVDFFARWLSASTSLGAINVDRDVYSLYKKNHPSGFRLSETLVYRPYQDVEFYTGITLVSNANWIDLDQYQSRLGARLQWGNVRWDINARNLQFKADENRLRDNSRSVIQARVLIEKWLYPRYRLELAAAVDYDVDTSDETLRLQLSVHQSEGRGYLDYSPAETLFRNLRQINLTPRLNDGFN